MVVCVRRRKKCIEIILVLGNETVDYFKIDDAH